MRSQSDKGYIAGGYTETIYLSHAKSVMHQSQVKLVSTQVKADCDHEDDSKDEIVEKVKVKMVPMSVSNRM